MTALALTAGTDTVDRQVKIIGPERLITPRLKLTGYLGVFDLLDRATLGTDQMVVIAADGGHPLVLRLRTAKRISPDKAGVDEQLDRVVDRPETQVESVGLDSLVKTFDDKMTIRRHDFVKDNETLGSLAQASAAQVAGKGA